MNLPILPKLGRLDKFDLGIPTKRKATNPMSIHDDYVVGRKFRVIREGCELSGWMPSRPGSYSGWRKPLHIGDVIEVQSVGFGFGSDPGFGVHWKADCIYAEFRPSTGGIWAYHPADGYLEPLSNKLYG